MTPIQQIDYGDPVSDEDRNAMLFDVRGYPVLNCVLQYLRDEAFAALAEGLRLAREGRSRESALAMGSFDGLTQAIVKLKAISETPPKGME
jgi:hypothetical protein